MVSILYHPYFGGRAIYISKFAKILKGLGYDITIFTVNYGNMLSQEEIDGIKVIRLNLDNFDDIERQFTFRTIGYLFKHRLKFDVVHLHGLYDVYGLFAIYGILRRARIITHMSLLGSDDPVSVFNNRKLSFLRKKLSSCTSYFIAISTPLADAYRQMKFPTEKLKLIPNGVDLSIFRKPTLEDRIRARKQLNLPLEAPVALMVGAVIPRKRVHTVVRCWEKVCSLIPNAHLLLVGPDRFDSNEVNSEELNRYVADLKDFARDSRLNVKFCGQSSQIVPFYHASDLLIFASKNEGFGNVLVEAMACGIPCIATEMQGVSQDIITRGVDGIIISRDEELEPSIVKLLSDSELCMRMGLEARYKVEKKFDIQKIVQEYISCYES